MAQGLPSSALELAAPVLTAFNIGTWEDDVRGDLIRGDAMMATIFGLTQWEAAQGLPWSQLAKKFHPDDLAHDTEQRRHVRSVGGLFVWEHRVVHSSGEVRWVLARGHFSRDENDAMRGRGIIIDLTDSRSDDDANRSPRFFGQPQSEGTLVERMADHALTIWHLTQQLESQALERFKPMLETLLFEMGRQIAAESVDGTSPQDVKRKSTSSLH